MHAVDLIASKRDGQALSRDEIRWFVTQYTSGQMPDYQASAFLMAVYLRGMTREETTELTLAMAESGKMLDLSDIADYAVDKHSSGGVGDKTTLVVLPLVASFGVPVAKMSGRGLGHTGGTLDKLEAIAGYDINLDEARFRQLARANGIVLCGQTGELAPADGKIYALRDVTATVSSLPLIASSIMSKKLAAGANGIVLDVKAGRGAFMATVDAATELAEIMVNIGVDAGRDVIALISDMNQPLGHAVGHSLEIQEAIETLSGQGPDDFRNHCLEVVVQMLRLAGRGERWTDAEATRREAVEKLSNGQALAKFRLMVEAQGGDVAMVDDPSLLPVAKIVETYDAPCDGFIKVIAAENVARACASLGAGREKKGDPIDLTVGLMVHKKVGDSVRAGEPLVTIYASDAARLAEARICLEDVFAYDDAAVAPLPLFHGRIDGIR